MARKTLRDPLPVRDKNAVLCCYYHTHTLSSATCRSCAIKHIRERERERKSKSINSSLSFHLCAHHVLLSAYRPFYYHRAIHANALSFTEITHTHFRGSPFSTSLMRGVSSRGKGPPLDNSGTQNRKWTLTTLYFSLKSSNGKCLRPRLAPPLSGENPSEIACVGSPFTLTTTPHLN